MGFPRLCMLHKRSTLGTNQFPDTTIRAVESRDALQPSHGLGTTEKQWFREYELLDEFDSVVRIEDNEVMIQFFVSAFLPCLLNQSLGPPAGLTFGLPRISIGTHHG